MANKDFLTIDDFDTDNKTVLVRVDLNSPMDPEGNILDDMRIKSHVTTIKELKNARVVLLAHQSRPGKNDFTTMNPHALLMSKYLGKEIKYVDDIFGTYARQKISSMEKGDVILLENVRFYSEESLERPVSEHETTHLVRKLAPLFDIFLNDAFSVSHRSHLSIMGFTNILPTGAGRIMEKEVTSLDLGKKGGGRPSIFVLGGAKVDDSMKVIEHVLSNNDVDRVLVTGVVGNVMLAASGVDIGKENMKFIEKQGYIDQIERAKKLLVKYNDKIGLPQDLALNDNNKRIEVGVDELASSNHPINDIGLETIVAYSKEIEDAKTVVLNGPAGVSENEEFALGTREIIKAAAKAIYAIVGGGHISAEVLNMGVENSFYHLSTAGGACIDYLAGEKLPGVEILKDVAAKSKSR
ncbi:MAG: phosphoglycerate kinase [Methanohalobium sp.]|uniref:phosphoglycerate kinase n=1 Tax=Methanohalobium sp. TaxID=2837493 RepID=UPI00397E2AF4